MELNDLITLAKAGFSKNEILALTQPSMTAPLSKEAEAVSVQTAVPEEKTEGSSPMAAADPLADRISQLGNALDSLEKKIQGINLIQAQMNTEAIRKDLPEDIIARIVNPYSKKEV